MHRYRNLLLLSLASAAAILTLPGCSRTPEERYARAIEKGKKLLAEKEYARAALECQNAAQVKPKSAETQYLLGDAAMNQVLLPTAIKYYRKAAEFDPQYGPAQLRLADLMLRTHNDQLTKEAESRIQKVLTGNPEDDDALLALATIRVQFGQIEDAEKYLNEVLKRSPSNLKSAIALAQVKLSLGSQTITGASIKFTNIHNWDTLSNKLFIYIAASSASTPGTSGGGTGSVACSGACGSLSGDVTNNGTGFGNILNHTTYYTDSTDGTTINDEWDAAHGATDPLYSAAVGTGAKSTSGGRTKVGEWVFPFSPDSTLTYNFTTGAGSQVADLQTYIGSAAGGDFALLLDSDCHYFFDDITFTLTTSSPVPEPGSVLLLATALAGVCLVLRKKKAATLA